MKRLLRIVRIAAAFIIGVPLLAAVFIVLGANTGPGGAVIEQLADSLSGGAVRIEGLSGRFPDALRIGQISVSDDAGTWLTIEQFAIDWSPLRLFHREVRVATLAAAHVALARLPHSAAASTGDGAFPFGIAVDDLHIERFDLSRSIAGGAPTFGITGNLHLPSVEQGTLALDVQQRGGAGHYNISLRMAPDALAARIDAAEPSRGPLADILGLPDIGALSVSASLDGPRNAERAQLALSAGTLTARGQGTIDLAGKTLNIDLAATAPAMMPRPDLDWQSARFEAHLAGSVTSPDVTGHLDIEGLHAIGGGLEQVKADIRGDSGTLDLTAVLAGLHIPGPQPGLFAAAPLVVHATAILSAAARPVVFSVAHPLVAVSGEAGAGDAPSLKATVTLPALAPFAAIAGLDVEGRTTLTASVSQQGATTRFIVDSTVGITGGLAAARGLIGDNATIALRGSLQGDDVSLDNFALMGHGFNVSAKGGRTRGVFALGWKAALSDLSSVAPGLAGTLSAAGRVDGPPRNVAITAQAQADVAAAGLPREPLTLSLSANGLPAAPSGTLDVEGRLAGAPLQVAATMTPRSDGALDVSLDRLAWKGATGQGKLSLAPGAIVPLGEIRLHLPLAALNGLGASGSVDAAIETVERQGKPQARLRAEMLHLALNGGSVDRLAVDARIDDPTTDPKLSLVADAEGVRTSAAAGAAHLTANGAPDSLALRLSSDLRTTRGPATLTATGTARLTQRDLLLSSLQADYGGETARLLAPVRFAFAEGLTVGSLRLAIGKAVIALAGRFTPTLALSLSARDVSPSLAKPFAPAVDGVGTIALDGQFTGTLATPTGALHLTGRGLRGMKAMAGGLPAADVDATATLAGGAARVEASLTAGSAVRLRLAGAAPLQAAAPIDLRLRGTADLAMLDPLLTATGRTARGQVTVDLAIAGTMTTPRITGSVRLGNGSVQDFARGIHVTDLTGLIEADGNTLRIAQLGGHAGPGTVAVTGTLGLIPSQPIELTITARNARPLASDLLTATMDADLTLRGELQGNLRLGGEIRVSRASINIPDSFPQGVAVLSVRRPGQKASPAAEPERPIALALTIAAPQQVFVRGHGIDAEMGGTVKLGGTIASPAIGGGLDLRRGTFSLAGQTLTFSSGKVSFGGSGLVGKLDPTIDLVAQTSANNITATLAVTGYASAPKIRLSSSPQLPQDEILGQLLFGKSVKQLSPFQLAATAQAVASIIGAGGSDPLNTARNSLGLDRLSIGSAASGGGATVEAGKYVAKGVFVGARQSTGGGTQAKVQIDLTGHLKLESRLGTGGVQTSGPTTPENDPGSSIGLSYQFEY